jgi:hypothetical protein
MKLAVITPPKGLKLLSHHELGYHMVLPQYMTIPSYAIFYHRVAKGGHFIMVDNGAAELGKSIEWATVLDVADQLDAAEIVMPDVLDNALETWIETEKALPTVPARRRAMCPQGRSWSDWESCLERMVNAGCRTICVAKRYEKLPGGRARGVEIICKHNWHLDHDIHYLGVHKNPLAEAQLAVNQHNDDISKLVRGIDTAAPIAYAQAGIRLDATDSHHSLDWTKEFPIELASSNIALLLSITDSRR